MAVLIFGFILFIGLKTDILKVSKEGATANNRQYSFSRFQLWLWTLTICPCFVLFWGVGSNEPFLNNTGLILLGISASVTIISTGISQVHKSIYDNNESKAGYSLKIFNESISFWTDLLMDEQGQFSIGRLQQLIFTLIYVVIYIIGFFGSECNEYPDFSEQAFYLMGISTGTYLVGKGLRK